MTCLHSVKITTRRGEVTICAMLPRFSARAAFELAEYRRYISIDEKCSFYATRRIARQVRDKEFSNSQWCKNVRDFIYYIHKACTI